jgi:hypothetical protein
MVLAQCAEAVPLMAAQMRRKASIDMTSPYVFC